MLRSLWTHRESFDAQVGAFLWYATHDSVFDVAGIEVGQCESTI